MADCVGRGIGEDGDAERPPLVFAMAEMLRKKTDQILERWKWHAGLVSLWLLYFKGLNRNGGN